ncbi:MAG TPA: penicillin-binding transpeptidase domain-containing protein, partial [Planctomycetota bacterium]|nr:penicillin-binding transpeptidase domain-containing protein [Planctomycetota bacterium]
DERGVLGLESALEPVLRGKRGWIASTPLADGEDGGRVESVPPQRGLNVTLTLDLAMQRACERALDHFQAGAGAADASGRASAWPGSIVLLDPQTGSVLALASSPRPTREQLTEQYGTLLADTRHLGLLRDRSIGPGTSGNLAPPGSTFKPLAALAALSLGVVSPSTTFDCESKLTVGGTQLGCTGLHHDIDLVHALAASCNIYFYNLAEAVGGDVLRDVARTFGLDRPTGLLDGNEVLAAYGIPTGPGLRESAVALKDGHLSRIETMRLGIGQATLDDVTPLQIAVAIAAVGTGQLRPPSLIASVEGYGALPPRAARPLPFDAASFAAVRAGLAACVETTHGTARNLALPADLAGLTVAAKTGTPQVQGREDHSWAAGYMPREKPRLAFAILLEHTGRHGGDACIPVLNELLASGAVHDHLLRETRP